MEGKLHGPAIIKFSKGKFFVLDYSNGSLHKKIIKYDLETKKKEIYGVSSEDMDILTFGSPILIRGLSGNKNIKEINLEVVLDKLRLNQNESISKSF